MQVVLTITSRPKRFLSRFLKKSILRERSWLVWVALHKMCLYLKLFWSIFSCIWAKFGEILGISSYSVQIRENTDQKNSKYGHALRSGGPYLRREQFTQIITHVIINWKVVIKDSVTQELKQNNTNKYKQYKQNYACFCRYLSTKVFWTQLRCKL